MVLEFAVPTAVVSLMWVTIYDGNSPLSLSLVVLDTVLAPFSDSGYAEDPAGLCGDHRFCQDDAGTDIYGCASCCCCDGIKSDHRWKSNGNMAGKAGAFFKAGTDICGNVQFFQSSTIYPGYEYAEGEGCTGNPCPGCFRICTRLVCGVYLPKGSQYGGFMMYGTGMRNISAGAVIAAAYFPGEVMFPVMIGTLFQQVLAALFGKLLAQKKEKQEFC